MIVAGKYDALRRNLKEAAPGEVVSLTFNEIDVLVGGLPPSAQGRTWWANTTNATRSQARAWLSIGRRVIEVRLGEAVVFSPVGAARIADQIPRIAAGSRIIYNGINALGDVLSRAGYATIAQGVAAHTVFLHPATVAQTGGHPLFRTVRDPGRRGTFGQLPNGQNVMFDDNTTPTLAFLWSAQRVKGPDVQYNHLWGDPRNPDTYTALWNLCATPAFLAKTTDGSNHPEVLSLLRFRSHDLYGFEPGGEEVPKPPDNYDMMIWPESPAPVEDLEKVLRRRMSDAPKSRAAISARQIGWLFSDWMPDTTLA
jgi:hypothetical protein